MKEESKKTTNMFLASQKVSVINGIAVINDFRDFNVDTKFILENEEKELVLENSHNKYEPANLQDQYISSEDDQMFIETESEEGSESDVEMKPEESSQFGLDIDIPALAANASLIYAFQQKYSQFLREPNTSLNWTSWKKRKTSLLSLSIDFIEAIAGKENIKFFIKHWNPLIKNAVNDLCEETCLSVDNAITIILASKKHFDANAFFTLKNKSRNIEKPSLEVNDVAPALPPTNL